jgi:formylglycine-generating enzyme required for sulfatase activity
VTISADSVVCAGPRRGDLAMNGKDGTILVRIPAGEFEMGDEKDPDCPKHRVLLSEYWIGVYAVTNGQYRRFVSDTGHRPPDNQRWNDNAYAEHPVTDVDWNEATGYAQWAGMWLPTEAQWEKAARGPEGLIWPWGNEWDAAKCRNSGSRGNETTCPAWGYPAGVSGYGTYEQSGNVWEWCADWYGSDYYMASPEKDPAGPTGGSDRVFRGGSWGNVVAARVRGARRGGVGPS